MLINTNFGVEDAGEVFFCGGLTSFLVLIFSSFDIIFDVEIVV